MRITRTRTGGIAALVALGVAVAGLPAAVVHTQVEILYQNDLASESGGSYTLDVFNPSTRSEAIGPAFDDFAVGVDASCPQTEVDCRYGLELTTVLQTPQRFTTHGLIPTPAYYRFLVNPIDGTGAVLYRPYNDGLYEEPSAELVPWTDSTAIRGGTESNRVAVLVQGSAFRLFVNGEQVGGAVPREAGSLRIHLVGMTTAPNALMRPPIKELVGPPVVVGFGNLVVSAPGPVDTLGLVLRGQ